MSRCGRTARIGNKGAALLLISPSEETYIEFLAINQKVKLAPVSDPSHSNIYSYTLVIPFAAVTISNQTIQNQVKIRSIQFYIMKYGGRTSKWRPFCAGSSGR